MSRLVRAEVLKVLTVRTLLWLVLGEVAFVAVALVARVVTFKGTHDAAVDRGRVASIGRRGEIAQLVEHTTENRGVPGSNPGLATP